MKVKLGDITSKIGSGATPRGGKNNYEKIGVAFIRSQNVRDFYFDYNQLAFINDNQASQLSNVKVKLNDILLNITGDSITRCTLSPKDILPARVSQHVAIIRCHKNINSKFIMYNLQYMKNYLLSICKIGGTRNALTKEMLANLTIDLPPKEMQDKIAALLGALDDKIALNKKINATLEAMAKTLYMHEFFRKPPNSKLGDVIIENPKSTIPVGAAKLSVGEFPFFTSGDSVLNWTDSLVDGRNIFLNTGGNAGIKFHVGKAAYSTDTWCIAAENLTDYLYLLLKVVEPELDKKFFQGTGLKHLQKPLLKERAIYIPTETEREQFNSIVRPCFTKISANVRESRRLAELRDWLLPMLMNGQIDFKEKI